MDVERFLARVRRQARDADRLAADLELERGDRAVNVHSYAWPPYEAFLRRFYSDGGSRVLALSMNPGPFGAVQTGIPFCDTRMARSFLPDFDRLIAAKPEWLTAERSEVSAGHLVRWSTRRFGGIEGLYARMLLAMTCPVAILRGPARNNVPLPALRRRDQAKVESFIARHAPEEIRLAEPSGVFILGEWAERVWRIVTEADRSLAALPSVVVPHPAAHISNTAKDRAWTSGYRRLEGLSGRRRS